MNHECMKNHEENKKHNVILQNSL